MSNWLADPNVCVIRLKAKEGGCIILAGRNEVMSRSTRVHRTVEDPGTKTETTTWRAGNVEVYRNGEDSRRTADGGPNLNLVRWVTGDHGTELPNLSPGEAVIMSDVLRAAAVNAGGSACGGQTLLELMWQEMMVVMDRLMTGQAAEHDVGIAQGIAYSIAIMQNPYRPNVDDIREQAMAKWEEDN